MQLFLNGDIQLDSAAQNYLPVNIPLPVYRTKSGEQIEMTVANLLTYSSGWENAFAHADSTTYEELIDWFTDVDTLPLKPGTWKYVNTDFSTLGMIYSYLKYSENDQFYNEIPEMLDSLCNALGMGLSSVNPNISNPVEENIALPYVNKKTGSYHFSSWPANYAAGGIYSSIDDMRVYLKANLGENAVFSTQLLDSMQYLRQQANNSHDSIGLGWFYTINSFKVANQQVSFYWKAGGTPSFKSYIQFAELTKPDGTPVKAGVVVLANNGDTDVGPTSTAIFRELIRDNFN